MPSDDITSQMKQSTDWKQNPNPNPNPGFEGGCTVKTYLDSNISLTESKVNIYIVKA